MLRKEFVDTVAILSSDGFNSNPLVFNRIKIGLYGGRNLPYTAWCRSLPIYHNASESWHCPSNRTRVKKVLPIMGFVATLSFFWVAVPSDRILSKAAFIQIGHRVTFTRGDGQEGVLNIQYCLEDDDTPIITIELPQPIKLKRIRAKPNE